MGRILYLEAFNDSCKNVEYIDVTLETCIVLFLFEFLDHPSNIKINLIPQAESRKINFKFSIRKNAFNLTVQTQDQFRTKMASQCNFPIFVNKENVIIAGLCGVCRAIIKSCDQSFRTLLGFKESCLLSPSESSSWTKFCEIDIITATKQVLNFHNQLLKKADDGKQIQYQLPNEFACFECHMNQPVRVHNIHKVATHMNESVSNGRNISILNIEHKFVEDLNISIADILLYPNFWFVITTCKRHSSDASYGLNVPLTLKWINTMQQHSKISKCISILNGQTMNIPQKCSEINIEYIVNTVEKFSLYRHDPKRFKFKNRISTRQDDIDRSLRKIDKLGIKFVSKIIDRNDEISSINWQTIPFEALPEGGNLPEKRLQRKKHQLNGLATEIMRIASNGDRIVDFCCGAGHLGILIAFLLPSCKIYLLENKEESLMRAMKRVQQLKLKNVSYFQCNLDYFIGKFDIGTSLHACGVASDIVLSHCIRQRAKFVCCPCCYGQCNEMPHISYPRSELFRKNRIQLNDYLCIAHCADQTCSMGKTEKHIQGQLCMDIVDTDRKFYTEEFGYQTTLTRLYPEDCTPKNRLLIGII